MLSAPAIGRGVRRGTMKSVGVPFEWILGEPLVAAQPGTRSRRCRSSGSSENLLLLRNPVPVPADAVRVDPRRTSCCCATRTLFRMRLAIWRALRGKVSGLPVPADAVPVNLLRPSCCCATRTLFRMRLAMWRALRGKVSGLPVPADAVPVNLLRPSCCCATRTLFRMSLAMWRALRGKVSRLPVLLRCEGSPQSPIPNPSPLVPHPSSLTPRPSPLTPHLKSPADPLPACRSGRC